MSRTPPMSVAVIGGGAIGSAAAWQLAARGHRVVLVEQFGPGHGRGASHGSSRIFRYSYPSALYIELARRAGRLWRRLERLHGQRFYARTGSVDHGDPAAVQRLARSLHQAGIEHSVLTPGEAELQWPGLRFDGMVLHHPDSGRLHADQAVAALQRCAQVEGAEIRFHTSATGVRVSPSGVRVLSASGSIRVDQVVVAAGAWTCDILESLPTLSRSLPALVTTQEQPAHFAPRQTPVGWPSFLHHPGGQYLGPAVYGLAAPDGVKVGEHGTGPRVTPQHRDFGPIRTVCGGCSVQRSDGCRGRSDPGRGHHLPVHVHPRPGHFVIDRRGPITVAAGFSGHGFKFAPAIGELIAGLVAEQGRSHPLPAWTSCLRTGFGRTALTLPIAPPRHPIPGAFHVHRFEHFRKPAAGVEHPCPADPREPADRRGRPHRHHPAGAHPARRSPARR
ncbi:MAG: FAD-dependent oxidoreductase [Nakamurella multipartita]